MTKSNYPADWDKRRASVLERDNYECQACGVTNRKEKQNNGSGLHAHHLEPISEGGGHSLDNLIALCRDCHVESHRKNKEQPYEPVYWNECIVCGMEYTSLEGYLPNYCTKRCRTKEMVEKALNVVNNDVRICSTCFTERNQDVESCPNCGNWDRKGRNEQLLEDAEIDYEHLLHRVIYWMEYGE